MSATRLESLARFVLPLGLALAIAAGLYAFGTQHVPDYSGTALFGRTATDTLPLKSWLATGLLALAALQLGLALWIYGRLPGVGVAGLRAGNVHRAIGVVALLVTLPIAYHCAFAYGVKTSIDTRITVHSLAGCFLYGAVAAKLIVVRSRCTHQATGPGDRRQGSARLQSRRAAVGDVAGDGGRARPFRDPPCGPIPGVI